MRTITRGLAVLVLGLAGCSASAGEQPAPQQTAGLVATTITATGQAPFDQDRTLLAPPGWTVSVFARVESARLLAWTPDDQLLVSRPKFGDVISLGSSRKTLLSGLNQPHGLAFDGDTLYVAESDQVNAYTYKSGVVSARKIVVDDLPDAKSPELRGAYSHALKSVTVGKDGSIYVSVGSTGNISAADREATPERASILKVAPGGGKPTVYARGVRNGTGLAVDPDGAVWTAVNHRDNVGLPADGYGGYKHDVVQEYVNDHPMEQLARLTEGRELGWPYCNPDPQLEPTVSYSNRPFLRDVQTNPDGAKLDCGSLPPTEQGMGAHSAPLGLSFVTVPEPGALVGIHGSWNRRPPRPPEVSFYAWKNGTLGPQQTLLTGFQLKDGSRWGRPVMAVQGTDGALYVSDDQAGAIYRVTTGKT
ncbi:PQQ-dependent sugar dehydrogenase [Actinoplanes derwentensis]|uniref:Glucose/arabinose dehydrogenase, beta-propeller fold n=1 Tax=Actinoplanes derwentensis TaxID=113562 RepID=A0A1H1VGL3_9ACTN|nr:gluconolaconase [Actinoplanes derwentensis]SDS83249.1 Glucose/arabinose dehydrogenase, beta-propeller fold [Actinoplanes derwentensis]